MTDKPESETTAGLSVGEVLPVVAVASGDDLYRSEDCVPFGRLSPAGPPLVALTPHAPAQAIIERLTRELQEMTDDRDSWLQQADDRCADALRFAKEADALKAKQVADIDEVMRLADAYADAASWTGYYSNDSAAKNDAIDDCAAAREALRSGLTPKEPT